jgi:hypothetical protein
LIPLPAGSVNPNQNQAMNKPSTLDQIRNIAEFMFNDKAIESIDIDASFGMVRVYRDGRIVML